MAMKKNANISVFPVQTAKRQWITPDFEETSLKNAENSDNTSGPSDGGGTPWYS